MKKIWLKICGSEFTVYCDLLCKPLFVLNHTNRQMMMDSGTLYFMSLILKTQ